MWDSDKLHTCICDTGYHGFDCALRECPTGDDPLTTGQANEIQLVVCEVSTCCTRLSTVVLLDQATFDELGDLASCAWGRGLIAHAPKTYNNSLMQYEYS